MVSDKPVEFITEEIEAYIENGEKKPATYAHVLGVTVDKFYKLVAIHKEKKMSEPSLEITVQDNPKRKYNRAKLTDAQKIAAYESYKSGVSTTKICERFGCSPSFVWKLFREFKENPPVKQTEPVAPIVEEIIKDSAVEVSFEGEYLVIRLHKKHVTRKLLDGVI